MTNCHKGSSLATNNAFQITDLCLRTVHRYTFTDTSGGGAQPCLAFFQGTERQKKGVGTGKLQFNLWSLQAQKQFVIRIFCYTKKEFIHGGTITGETGTHP
jgi:hypothetical protein